MRISDWSSDVCSSDLADRIARPGRQHHALAAAKREPRHRVLEAHAARQPQCVGDRVVRIGIMPEAHAARRRAERGRMDREESEEHTSELQSLMRISYAVFCLNKKKINQYKPAYR